MKLQTVLSSFEAARAASNLQRDDGISSLHKTSTVGLIEWLRQRLLAELEHAERVARAANQALAQLQALQ